MTEMISIKFLKTERRQSIYGLTQMSGQTLTQVRQFALWSPESIT